MLYKNETRKDNSSLKLNQRTSSITQQSPKENEAHQTRAKAAQAGALRLSKKSSGRTERRRALNDNENNN